MMVNRLMVKNWRNFPRIDVPMKERQFLVGPNASGKSNLLDVFRFLRDIATTEGGGLQKAVKDRGGVSKLRCLAGRRDPEIVIETHLSQSAEAEPEWRYSIGIKQEARGKRQTYLTHERVWQGERQILDRPDDDDKSDRDRLTQTYLEQINANQKFRDIAQFFQSVTYLHLVPQLLRFADSFQGTLENDPFGQGFLERIAKTTGRTQSSRLSKIEEALKIAVPQLQQLKFIRDDVTGRPHLQALYSHWRPQAGWQREDQFSDGTLRLIGLLWSLLEADSLLLLEEPELSLNAGIVAELAPLIHRMQRMRHRQVLVSTHSDALLTEAGIDGREVLVFSAAREGTEVKLASDFDEVRVLLANGFTVGEAVLPRTKPESAGRLGAIQ